MSDQLRPGSSPQRVPSSVSRPHWPWASYHHSSQSSISTHSTGTAGGQTPASWESRSFASPGHSGSTSMLPAPSPTSRPAQPASMAAAVPYGGESMRHWQFTASLNTLCCSSLLTMPPLRPSNGWREMYRSFVTMWRVQSSLSKLSEKALRAQTKISNYCESRL